ISFSLPFGGSLTSSMVPFSFVSDCRSYLGALGGCLFCATSDKAQKRHDRRRMLRKPSDAVGVIRSRMAPLFQGATGRLGAVENQHRNYRLAVSSCAKNEASFPAPIVTLFSIREMNSLVEGRVAVPAFAFLFYSA